MQLMLHRSSLNGRRIILEILPLEHPTSLVGCDYPKTLQSLKLSKTQVQVQHPPILNLYSLLVLSIQTFPPQYASLSPSLSDMPSPIPNRITFWPSLRLSRPAATSLPCSLILYLRLLVSSIILECYYIVN